MNTIKIAVIMVRLVGLQFMFQGLIYLTYLPERMFTASNARTMAVAEYAGVEIRMVLLRAALHVLCGVALCFLARPVANAVAAGLIDNQESLEDAA